MTEERYGQSALGEPEEPRGEPEEPRASQMVMILLRLFRALERVDTDLTPQQYRILRLAGAGGERSAKLAERLAVAKPTLTATADGLVAAGYARRDAEPGDRRVVRLCLTAAGREAVDRADAAYTGWLDQLLAETGEPEQVLQALDTLDQAMDEVRRARRAAADGAPEPGRRTAQARTAGRSPGPARAAAGAPEPARAAAAAGAAQTARAARAVGAGPA